MSLFNRAEVVDLNFTRRVEEGNFPDSKTHSINSGQGVACKEVV